MCRPGVPGVFLGFLLSHTHFAGVSEAPVYISAMVGANPGHMAAKMIPDDELLGDADRVTIWVASRPAPKDVWSLREAAIWASARPGVTLHRPARDGRPPIWLDAEQVLRVSQALAGDTPIAAAS